MRIRKTSFIVLMFTSGALLVAAETKPKLTLDEFFNSVSFPRVGAFPPTATPS